jgi:type VI secretion system secreted protein VgrG
MTIQYTQPGRLLVLKTPLGQDVLLLSAFSGREELSHLFAYRLDLLSEDVTITPEQILGKAVTWSVEHFVRESPLRASVRRH